MQAMATVTSQALRLEPLWTGLFSARAWDAGAVSERNLEGESDLAAQIVELHPRLLRFAWSLTHDWEAAQDLAQEAIARALTARWRFEPGTNLKAWLFRILRNVHLNILRSSGTHPPVLSIEELVGEPAGPHEDEMSPVEASVIERADLERIAEVYRTLPRAFALPLYLTAIEELSYAETAAILDVPVGTVMSRVYRARRLLISRLAGGR